MEARVSLHLICQLTPPLLWFCAHQTLTLLPCRKVTAGPSCSRRSHWSRLCCCPQSPATDATGWGSWVSSETHLHAPHPSPRALPTSKIFIPTKTFTFLFLEPVSFPPASFQPLRIKSQHIISLLTGGIFSCPKKFRTILKFELPRGNLNHKILDHWTWKFLAEWDQTKW